MTTTPPLTRLRYAIGRAVFAVADRLEDFAAWWNGIDFDEHDPEKIALNEARTRRMVMQMRARQAHPCGECDGRGWVRVPDDWEPCPTCETSGIDPAYSKA